MDVLDRCVSVYGPVIDYHKYSWWKW